MLIQQLVNGLFSGSLYALFAVGYTLVFGVLDILNLAHAAIFTAAAFSALALTAAGFPLPLALACAIVFAGILGILLDRVAFAPLRRRNAGTLVPLISSIGVAIVIRGIIRGIWGSDELRFGNFGSMPPFHVGGLTFGILDLVVLTSSLLLVAILSFVLRATTFGRNVRAVAQDRVAAALLGIDIERTIWMTFFLASALGGAAGILTGLQFNSVSVDMGAKIELKGLAVIVLGGMGSVSGAVLGALLIGIVESLSVAYISSNFRDAIAFLVMFLILILRPQGLFGRRAQRTG
ncbi:MAG TPA: branched-chain amino acid ABC transporter permease [Candidatus Baltobacteraceae bacterium]|nr:branched-chain amino acid ABC transporter permease [Candidatus Baltobacteraceae bacterium]